MKQEHIDKEIAYVKAYLDELVGAKVVNVAAVKDDSDDWGWPEVWPVLVFEKPDGTLLQVEVSCDPEGNGPGHLFVTEKKS
jgi:hypothetical protein